MKAGASEMVRLESATGNNDIGIDFYRGTDHKWQIRNNGNDDNFFIIPASSDDDDAAFTIKQDGNVGIGTTSPKGLLHIEGDTNRIIFSADTSNLAKQHRIEFFELFNLDK